mgnify:CR=1 FL=1
MKLRRVAPNKIFWPEVRVTAQFDPDLYEMFKKSIQVEGQLAPIICSEVDPGELDSNGANAEWLSTYLMPNGKVVVGVDGLHRCQEAIKKRESAIDVAMIEGGMVDVFTRNIFLDHLRGKTPVSQMRRVIDHLAQEYKLDSETIATKTGLTRDYVEGIMEINELTPYCLEALDEGRLKLGHCRHLTKLRDPVKQDVIAADAITFNRSVEYVKDTVRMALESAGPEVASPPPVVQHETAKVKCGVCADDYLPGDLRMIPLCPACFSATFQLIAELRRREQEDKVPQQVPNVVPQQ